MKVSVIGGGLGGLAVASLMARQGVEVVLHERASELGGRARSQITEGFVFDQGPHALYLGGPGEAVLRSLGVPLEGKIPDASGSLALLDGELHSLPVGMASLVATDLLSMGEKMELGWLLLRLPRIDAGSLTGSIADWLAANVRSPRGRALLHAIVRLSTYTNAPDVLDAKTAIARLQQVTAHNVLYLHGGWQSLADSLARIARESGVTFGGEAASLPDADAIVLAMGPRAAHALLPGDDAIHDAIEDATPAHASAMQVALRTLPNPANRFVLGIDRPYYFAVQSLTSRIAPEGSHVAHVAKYRGDATKDELEALLDIAQPGCRDHVVHARFMPSLVVAHAIARRFVRPSTPNVHVVGDWVDAAAARGAGEDSSLWEKGMLLDTVLATARATAERITKEKKHAA